MNWLGGGDGPRKLGSDVLRADVLSACRRASDFNRALLAEFPPQQAVGTGAESGHCGLAKTSVRLKARSRGMATELLLLRRDRPFQCNMKNLTTDQVKLRLVGPGNMGSRIAQCLLDHGYPLVAYAIRTYETKVEAGWVQVAP